jgi:glycosyltransferase involved in cell wall biosynthesis
MTGLNPPKIAIIVKGYPRLSETFIAQEIRALEQAGFVVAIYSLRHPTDHQTHPIHGEITAPVHYLPEYLHHEPWRVLRSWWQARRLPGYRRGRDAWWADFRRDPTRNRLRRWGQALVMAAELPADYHWIYVHFIHTPGSVGRYAALIRQMPFSLSAHAKDIHTTPDWEIQEKLADCQWLAVCSAANAKKLRGLADDPDKVNLVYHGLDFQRFRMAKPLLSERDGRDPANPVQLLSIGRAVDKKGFDLLVAALAQLPDSVHWRWQHIGGGPRLAALKQQAVAGGIADRLIWSGPQSQTVILAACRAADLFVLPSRVTIDGDRDGLPNVLMEAASQGVCLVATPVGAIAELVVDGQTGCLVAPDDVGALATQLEKLIADPALRQKMGLAVQQKLAQEFELGHCIKPLLALLMNTRF